MGFSTIVNSHHVQLLAWSKSEDAAVQEVSLLLAASVSDQEANAARFLDHAIMPDLLSIVKSATSCEVKAAAANLIAKVIYINC